MKLFFRVLCFTIGISGAFFVLGLGASAAGSFLNENRMLFARIGGVLVILFGLYQLGVFGSSKDARIRAQAAAQAGEDDHVSHNSADHGVCLQFCLDSLRGPGSDQRSSDGGERGVRGKRVPA